MFNQKIPVVSSIAVTLTSTGCLDPIIADWDMSEVCAGEQCYALPGQVGEYTMEGSLIVEEGLGGTFSVSITDGEETETASYAIQLGSIGDGGMYKLRFEGEEEIAMTCTLIDIKLDCDAEDYSYSFTK